LQILRISRKLTLAAESDNLLDLPLDRLSGTTLDMGTLNTDTNNPDEVKSSAGVDKNVQKFNFTKEYFNKRAEMDGTLKIVKNLYINMGDDGASSYLLIPAFVWVNDIDEVTSAYASPTNILDGVSVYSLDFQTNRDDLTESDFTDDSLALVPPGYTEKIQYEDGSLIDTYNEDKAIPGTVFSYNGYDGDRLLFNVAYFNANPGESYPNGPYPGYWYLIKNGETIATFDISASYETDSDGNPIIFIPAIKVNSSGDQLDSVNIKWYIYDSSANPPYSEITPGSEAETLLFEKITGGGSNKITVAFWGPDDQYDQVIDMEPSDTVATPSETFEMSTMGITVGFTINGISYTFAWIQ